MSYNVLSKEGLIAWLERQPADTTYYFMHSSDCLAARYRHAHGLDYKCPGKVDGKGSFSEQLEYVGIRAISSGFIGTYGEALKVARTLP